MTNEQKNRPQIAEPAGFTPGPWRMKIYGKNQDGVTIHGDDDAPLASLYFLGKRETYANGRLMEVAPEMYALLDKCESALRHWLSGSIDEPMIGETENTINEIQKLLTEARGER